MRKSGMNTYISIIIFQHLIYYLRIGITIYYCKVISLCGSNENTIIVYFSGMRKPGGRGEARSSQILAAWLTLSQPGVQICRQGGGEEITSRSPSRFSDLPPCLFSGTWEDQIILSLGCKNSLVVNLPRLYNLVSIRHCTLLVLIDFCPVQSELPTWSSVTKTFVILPENIIEYQIQA